MDKAENKKRITIILIVLAVIFSFWFIEFNASDLIKRGNQFFVIIGKMFPPDITYTKKVASPILDTIRMSFAGTFIGSFFALIISPFCASNTISNKFVYTALKAVINIVRAIPVLIIALAVSFVFGIGAFSGTFAIVLYTFGIITRLTWKDIEQTSHNTFYALKASGIDSIKVYITTVFIDIFPDFLSNCLYVFESNVRHAAILGYVGAGGLGLILSEKISWGDYSKVGIILIILFGVVFVIEMLSGYLRRVLDGRVYAAKRTKRLILLCTVIIATLCILTIKSPNITSSGIKVFKGLFYGLVHPDTGLIFSFTKKSIPYLMLETVCIAISGTFIGSIFSIIIAFLGSRNISGSITSGIIQMFILVIRTMPAVIYGLIFIRVTGPGAFAGVLTLGVLSIGMCTKLYINSLDSFDLSTANAVKSMGTSKFAVIMHCVFPEVKNKFFASAIYRFDVNIREASILGLVSAGGIGTQLIFSMNGYLWSYAGAYILGLVVLVLIIDKLNSLIV